MAAAIWSQKDMRSPSGGEARPRGGTQVGKAPPSPEMTISGLTRGRLVGDDDDANLSSSPALPDVAARPSGGLFRFWALRLQRLSANHFAPSGIPHRGRSAVKHCAVMPQLISVVRFGWVSVWHSPIRCGPSPS